MVATNELRRVEPAEMDRVAFASEQHGRFVERQTDHIGVRADDLDDEQTGKALDGVATRFAAPFAGGEIRFEVLLRQALEANPRFDQTLAVRLPGRDDAHAGINAMVAAGEKPQALRRLVEKLGLRQD